MGRGRSRRRAARWRLHASNAAVVVAALLLPLVAYSPSDAAFTATTSSSARFSAARISFDSASSSAAFTVSGARPGHGGTACITLTYLGTVAAKVRFSAHQAASGTLNPYLQVIVEEDTAAGSCSPYPTSPSTATTVYPEHPTSDRRDMTGRLDDLLTACASHASDCGDWQPAVSGETRTYRITYRLHGGGAAIGGSSSFNLRFEAQRA